MRTLQSFVFYTLLFTIRNQYTHLILYFDTKSYSRWLEEALKVPYAIFY